MNSHHMEVSQNGATPKWLIFFRDHPTKMDDDWGYSLGNLKICIHKIFKLVPCSNYPISHFYPFLTSPHFQCPSPQRSALSFARSRWRIAASDGRRRRLPGARRPGVAPGHSWRSPWGSLGWDGGTCSTRAPLPAIRWYDMVCCRYPISL